MTTNPITSVYNAPQQNERVPLKELGQHDFLKLLTTQLGNQDPFKPQSSGEMLNQMTQIASIQSMTSMQKNLTQLRTDQQLTMGQSLINKTVQVKGDDGSLTTGLVTKVTLEKEGVKLWIGNQSFLTTSLQAVLPDQTTNT